MSLDWNSDEQIQGGGGPGETARPLCGTGDCQQQRLFIEDDWWTCSVCGPQIPVRGDGR